MEFNLTAPFSPTGDQPQAIKELTQSIQNQNKHQTLLGVTGSGKTFTIANVIQNTGKPTLILAHNKTLAAQLYEEFKDFFPENAVEYFVSYYDYYQPEAFIPSSGIYIEKDLSINQEIEKLRLSATSALLSGRRDIIIISSVSCIYGIGNPAEFEKNTLDLSQGQIITKTAFLQALVNSLYHRSQLDFNRGSFRVKGDTIDIFPAYADFAIKVIFLGDSIEEIYSFDATNNSTIEQLEEYRLYPAKLFVTSPDALKDAIHEIQTDLFKQHEYFQEIGKNLEAKRLKERTEFDLEMIKELGYCSGIENYSRYFDQRKPGERPFCLLDYFPDDFLMVIDESHVTIPQVHAMYGGDRSRKENLVDYGFRLPAAMDNRPLKFNEFEEILNQVIYLSATPADYELEKCEGVYTEQLIRPTGLLDPIIEIRPSENQIDDLMHEIIKRAEIDERVLVTTLTKKMAEELTKYLTRHQIRTRYIHSDVDTLERVEIMKGLRIGRFDVLVGVNLLREGLDLPEVSLVVIIDADKEGFLRSHRSLTQTSGRAARNINGRVIMYADKITKSMQKTIDDTNRRRKLQKKYNKDHNQKPQPLNKKIKTSLLGTEIIQYSVGDSLSTVKENASSYSKKELNTQLKEKQSQMEEAAKNLDFLLAAKLRDQIKELSKLI